MYIYINNIELSKCAVIVGCIIPSLDYTHLFLCLCVPKLQATDGISFCFQELLISVLLFSYFILLSLLHFKKELKHFWNIESLLSRGSSVCMYVYPKCFLTGKKSGIKYKVKWTTCNILYCSREKRCPSCVLSCTVRKKLLVVHMHVCRKVNWIPLCTYIMHKAFINILCILRLNWRTWQNSAAVQETSRHLYQERTWQFISRHSVALHSISKCHYFWRLLNSIYR